MEITEVKVKLIRNKDDRLRAFGLITLDEEFVVRDIKIIKGNSGYFVAMPSRKTTDHCEKCGCKNHLTAKYCNECGVSLPENRWRKNPQGPPKLHADIVHPITSACRSKIQKAVLKAFETEMESSRQPGYKSDDLDEVCEEVPELIS